MIKTEIIQTARIFHGLYNTTIFLLFLYQASLGYRIRKARLQGTPAPQIIKIHRMAGPVFAILGIGGFLAGAILVLIDKGHLLHFPVHFFTGLLIVLVIVSTFLVSRRITMQSISIRKLHMGFGVVLLGLYLIQILIGLSVILQKTTQ